MKKALLFAAVFLFLFSAVSAAHVGRMLIKAPAGDEENVFQVPALPFPLSMLSGTAMDEAFFFNAEIGRGNLRLLGVQDDPRSAMAHQRYQQYFSGLEVFSGELVLHFKNNVVQDIEGEYFLIAEMELQPGLSREQAADFFRRALNDMELKEGAEGSQLLIFPVRDGDCRLAYRVVLERGANYSMTGIVDARSGEVLSSYSNVHTEMPTIGIGIGCHDEKLKLSTNFDNGKYWLLDRALNRPVRQFTFLQKENLVLTDTDNYWDQDPASVCAHAYMGQTYHYYYQVQQRNGIDNHNLDIKAVVHYPGGTDNAFWQGSLKMMFFFDPGKGKLQTAAALDVIAHEFTHGVTQYTSNLIYANESGALNEAFSDIMGTAVEFNWQPAGTGFLLADYYIGEDAFTTYGYAIRNLVNPNLGGNPCHLSQKVILPNTQAGDWGGVHTNSTIYGHAFYLLANGGTNKVSQIAVTGIGVDKAAKIYYTAFTSYLTPSSNFLNAANALLKAASVIYGSASSEYQQTVTSMRAIGWTVN
jgi:bacillolysin